MSCQKVFAGLRCLRVNFSAIHAVTENGGKQVARRSLLRDRPGEIHSGLGDPGLNRRDSLWDGKHPRADYIRIGRGALGREARSNQVRVACTWMRLRFLW